MIELMTLCAQLTSGPYLPFIAGYLVPGVEYLLLFVHLLLFFKDQVYFYEWLTAS